MLDFEWEPVPSDVFTVALQYWRRDMPRPCKGKSNKYCSYMLRLFFNFIKRQYILETHVESGTDESRYSEVESNKGKYHLAKPDRALISSLTKSHILSMLVHRTIMPLYFSYNWHWWWNKEKIYLSLHLSKSRILAIPIV